MKLHIVRPGDTLRKIARRFDIPVQRLLELNPSLDPEHPEPGEKVKIPRGKVPVARQRKGKATLTGEKPQSPHRKPESSGSTGHSETIQEGTESPKEQPLPKRPDSSPVGMMPPMPKAPEYQWRMEEEETPEQPEQEEKTPYFTSQPLPSPFPSVSFPYTGQPFSQTVPDPYAHPMPQPEVEDSQGWPVWTDPSTGQPTFSPPPGGGQPEYSQQPQPPMFSYPGFGQPDQNQSQMPMFPYPGFGQPDQEQPQMPMFPYPGFGQPDQGQSQMPMFPYPGFGQPDQGQSQMPMFPYPGFGQPDQGQSQMPMFPYPGFGQPDQGQSQMPMFPYPGFGQPDQEQSQMPMFPYPGYGGQSLQGEIQSAWPMPYPTPGFPQTQGFHPYPSSLTGASAREEDGNTDPPPVDWDISSLLREEESAWAESSTEK